MIKLSIVLRVMMVNFTFDFSILGELSTVQSLLPPDNSTQAFLSVIMSISHFILDPSQGQSDFHHRCVGCSVLMD